MINHLQKSKYKPEGPFHQKPSFVHQPKPSYGQPKPYHPPAQEYESRNSKRPQKFAEKEQEEKPKKPVKFEIKKVELDEDDFPSLCWSLANIKL